MDSDDLGILDLVALHEAREEPSDPIDDMLNLVAPKAKIDRHGETHPKIYEGTQSQQSSKDQT